MVSKTCPECGLDVSGLTPRDALAAVRSYPRRFHAAGVAASPEARAAAAALEQAARDLYRVLLEDQPPLAPQLSESRATIDEAAEHLAGRIGGANSDDWNRTGTRAGETVTALEIVRDAVHEGAHQLRAATG